MAQIPNKCWQVAAGNNNRNYADLCLEHNVILMGPGDCGAFHPHLRENTVKTLKSEGWSARKITTLTKFADDIQTGDLIVLRVGTREIHGIGYVVGGNDLTAFFESGSKAYYYSDYFSDVDGWDLQHFHYVHWIWKKPEGKPKLVTHPFNSGKQADTIRLIQENDQTKEVFSWIKGLPDSCENPYIQLFEPGKKIDLAAIKTKLFDYGISSEVISELNQRMDDLCRLAKWYRKYDILPSEHETVAHLVVPLLITLGWTSQCMALEWNRTDLALFPNGNRKDYEPLVLIEAKRLDQSCLSASHQVKRYGEELKQVKRLLVTDGIRYGLFTRQDETQPFPDKLSAYMNLGDLKSSYPIYGPNCGGADEVMLTLSAAWSEKLTSPKFKKSETE